MACNSPTDALTPSDARFPGCDPAKPRHVLRISFDDPGTAEEDRTYLPFESRLRSWDVNGGRDSELDAFDATTAEYVLDDRDRALDPTNASSVYAPDIVPNRMIWHRIDVDGATYDVFKGYIDGWGPEWPAHGVGDHTARIRASDGKKLLRLAAFEAADPDVLEYPGVLDPDQAAFLYPLNDPAGTKVVHHVRKKRQRRLSAGGAHGAYIVTHKRRWTTRETRSEVEGISGPSGTYKNSPQLAQPGLIKGSSDTSTRFRRAQSEYVLIPLDDIDDAPQTEITLEAWISPDSLVSVGTGKNVILSGPPASFGVNQNLWLLWIDANGLVAEFPDAGSLNGSVGGAYSFTTGNTYYVAVTVDSALDAKVWAGDVATGTFGQVSVTVALATVNSSGTTPYRFKIGGSDSSLNYFDGRIQWAGVYQQGLSQDRIEAHFRAGLLGFNSAGVGQRIEDILTLASTPASWEIQSGDRSVLPDRYAGVQPLEMVERAVAAEGEPSIFYFTSTNVPRFFGSDYRSSPPYDTPRFSFGGSNVKFEDTVVDPDDSFLFNDIRGTTEDGDKTFRAEDATSITRYGRLALPLNSLPIDNDADIQSYVDALLARYKDPLVRVPSFRLTGADASRREAMLSLELGDCVAISVPIPGGGSPLDQTSYIERRHLWQEQSSSVIRGEFSISPR